MPPSGSGGSEVGAGNRAEGKKPQVSLDLDNKTFRVVRNDGPGAEVDEDTVFCFRQDGSLVYADYSGGGVRLGRLVGVREANQMRHAYAQVNQEGQLSTGQGRDELSRTEDGKIRIVDSWEWESQEGRGECIFEEI